MKKIYFLRAIKLLFTIFIFSTIELHSQLNFSLATSQEYADNPFHSPLPISSLISSLEFGAEYNFDSFGIGYYSDYSIFHDIADRNYYWHQIGFWNSSDNALYGLYLEQRINNRVYELYDYSNYNGYLKYKLSIADINWFINSSLSLTDYSYLNDLDNILGSVGIMFNKSFETKTTFIGGLTYNYKNYFETNLNDPTLIGDSLEQSSSPSAFTSQFNFYGRIAQSIFENTGLAVQYSQQNIIGGTAKYVRQLDYIYGDESQYFDDPISYEGYTLSAHLTHILPAEILFKGTYSFTKKEYPSQGIYLDYESFDGATLRNDEQSLLGLSLSKSIDLSNSSIILSLSYLNVVNKSNSYWFDFKSNQINLNFDYQF